MKQIKKAIKKILKTRPVLKLEDAKIIESLATTAAILNSQK